MKKKFICTVCGYIYEGTEAPEKCPICKAPASKFKEMEDAVDDDMTFATVHVLGQAYKDSVNEDVIKGLKDHFNGECGEVGMYLAMARQADREGYPEIAEAYKRYAYEEADHASRFAELLGEVLGDTKSNLEARIAAEKGACEDKFRIAKLAKEQGSDAIHDTVHEMAKENPFFEKGSLFSCLGYNNFTCNKVPACFWSSTFFLLKLVAVCTPVQRWMAHGSLS